MKLRFTVDQAAAFRAGINAPTSVAEIEVDPASLTEEQRNQIADRLYGIDVMSLYYSDTWSSTQRSNTRLVANSPDIDGLLRAIAENQASVQAAAQKHAAFKVEQEKEKHAKQVQFYETVKANPLAALSHWYHSSIKALKTEAEVIDWLDERQHDRSVYLEHGDSTKLAMQDAELWSQVEALRDRINAEVKRRGDERAAARAAEEAMRPERLRPHFTDEEREMFERGYLNLTHVEARLDKEAITELRRAIEPPGYQVDSYLSPLSVRKPSSVEEFRLLRRIETLTGKECHITDDGVAIDIQTADGRTLHCEITEKSDSED